MRMNEDLEQWAWSVKPVMNDLVCCKTPGPAPFFFCSLFIPCTFHKLLQHLWQGYRFLNRRSIGHLFFFKAQKPTMALKNDHRAIFCCRARIFGTFVAQRLGLTFYIVCEGTRTGSLLPPKHGNFIMFLMNENHPFWGNQCWNYQWRVPIQECLLGFPCPRKTNGLLVPCMGPWLAERW